MTRPEAASKFRFGPYEADARAGELRKHGLRIQLQEKSFEVLVSLLEHSGELVTREELQHRLWPEGIFVDFDNGLNSAVNRLRDALRDGAHNPRYIETLPRRGYRFIAPVEQVRTVPPTLAVLPFANLSRDPAQDFFGEAVADALTTELGNVSSLRVISRQSVLHLKGTQKTLPEIARDLKADVIVEGSVLLVGGNVRITAQLVEAAPERHLWAKAYECALGDILTLQGQVAREIAKAVQVGLTPAEIGRLSRPRPVDPEAHIAYLKARHHVGQNSREGFQKGFQFLQIALELDPTHALAYARLAECYSLLGFWGHLPISEAYPRAKAAALRAIALDDALSTAHWALGWVSWLQDWDVDTCEAQTRHAIQLNPSDEGAHILYAVFLAVVREDPKAAAEAKLALDLDPLSLHVNTTAAWVHLFLKDYERALQQARTTLDLFPGSLQAYYVLGWAELGLSRIDASIEAFEKAAAISADSISIGYLGYAHARAGHRDKAISLLNELLSRLKLEYVPAKAFVSLYAGLGERDRAFEWLDKAYQEHDPMLFWMRAVPLFEALRCDPRFDEMACRVGLGSS
jgi:TolB-like protein/tetratricopeptide (TPR) repeat protein